MTNTDTGMVWLANADCVHLYGAPIPWVEAAAAVASLSDGTCQLTDGSSPGDWRLPTEAELDVLLVTARIYNCGAAAGPCIMNDWETACYGTRSQSSFYSVRAEWYWTATGSWMPTILGTHVRGFDLGGCGVQYLRKDGNSDANVWPVGKIQAD